MYKNIELLAVRAGKIMLEAYGRVDSVNEKSSNSDIVTEYDVRIQNFLVEELSKLYPDAKFLGEEGEKNGDDDSLFNGKLFIIDPIDGTTNFVRDYGKSAVSIALADKGEVIYGCCYNPYSEELFTASKNGGAFLNGKSIRCSCNDITHSVASVGTTPYNKSEFADATFAIMRVLFDKAMDVRRFGSAVLDLLDVACGRSDMFCELRLSPWDYAAAGLIATEAGALFTDMNGNKPGYDGRYSIIAANPSCYDYFMNSTEIRKYKNIF